MNLEKQWRMVKALAARTAEGTLDWRPAASDGAYQVSLGSYSVVLNQGPADSGIPDEFDYTVSVYDEWGDVADVVTDVDLSKQLQEDLPLEQMPYQTLHRLYDAARRKALGVDRILDAIIDHLEIPF